MPSKAHTTAAGAALGLALAASLPLTTLSQPTPPDRANPQATPGPASSQPNRAMSSLRTEDPAIVGIFGGNKAATRASRDAVMGFSLPTQVIEVLVRGGQEVTLGQPLLRGDDKEDQAILKAQKVRAESDLPVQVSKARSDQAEQEYSRLNDVFAKGGSGIQEVERARLARDTARLEFLNAKNQQTQEVIQLERIQARVDRFLLTAPFNGQVDTVMVDIGQAVSENEKVIRVVDVDPLWLDVPAPADDPVVQNLKEGDTAWVLLSAATAPRIAQAKVIEVSPTANLAARSRRIRIEVENPKGTQRILAGEPGWVRFTAPPPELAPYIRPSSTPQNAAQAATTQAP